MSSIQPDDFTVNQDRELLLFVMKKAPMYDRYEIFMKAQEQVPILSRKTILELYLRYHRFLFPLFTGKLSNENAGLTNISIQVNTPTKVTVDPTFPTLPLSDSGSETNSTSSNESSVEEYTDSRRSKMLELNKIMYGFPEVQHERIFCTTIV